MRLVIFALIGVFPSFSEAGFSEGTLIFLENSNNIVESCTNSTYSHVAIIMSDDSGKQWLYNAEPPRVRKYEVMDYFAAIGRMNEGTESKTIISILRPKKPYTKQEALKMRRFLDSQVNREYSVSSYIRNLPGKGIHCSELCSMALEQTGRYNFKNKNHLIAPGELVVFVFKNYVRQGKKLAITMKNRRTVNKRWVDWLSSKGELVEWSCWEFLQNCR